MRNFRDRVRTSINIKAQNILFFIAILLVVIIAILIRISPILRGPILIKAFDPWIQYYTAQYIADHELYEFFNWHDYKSWYPTGIARYKLRPGLPFTAAIVYSILNFFGLPFSVYEVCYFFPAFMGGFTVLAIYYLGKEILDRRMGLFAAFFLALNTGHAQRTMAGFFDNETIGVFATLMTFLFFIKAIKTGKVSHAILGGVFLGYLSLSWGGYQFVYLVIPIVCVILILMNKYDSNILSAYVGVQGTGLLISGLSTNFNYNNLFSDLEIGGVFLFTIILIIFHLIYVQKDQHPKFYFGLLNTTRWIIIPGAVVLAIAIWINPEVIPFGFGKRLQSVLSPLLRDQIFIVASVAEHIPSPWSIFYFNTLIPLVLLPLGIFFCIKRLSPADILLMLFTLFIFYFTGSMIRIILLFAPAASLMGAYGLVSVLTLFGSFIGEKKTALSRKRKRLMKTKKTISGTEILVVFLIVGFVCTAQVVHATDVSVNQLSFSQMAPGGEIHDWEESLTWMKNNLPGTAVVVSWWDYGYWITPVGNMTTVNDNATINQTRIGLTGMAMMQTNEIYSAKIFRRLKADYVLVYFGFLYSGLGGDEGKWPWMVRICNDNYERYKIMELEEDNWAGNSVFDEADYHNITSGIPRDDWFQSQLVRLMFAFEPTDPQSAPEGSFKQYYAQQINERRDDDGDLWVTHIPTNGEYDFKVFKREYFSTNGMIKLYKIDYTALDSNFYIHDPEIFDNGYGVFTLKNSGEKDIQINSVSINGEEYDFILGSPEQSLGVQSGEDVIVYIDIKSKGTTFKQGDAVNLTVSAQSEALEGTTFNFENYTSNFFVKKGDFGAVKINRANSNVVLTNQNSTDAYIELENIGNSIEAIKDFYVTEENNTIELDNIEYLSGSPVILPGEKCSIKLKSVPASFYPLTTTNMIGMTTYSDYRDATIFSANEENFKISIISEDRIISPESSIASDSVYRNHIPISFSQSYAYTRDNGEKSIRVTLQNTGERILGFNSIYVNNQKISIDKITATNPNFALNPNEINILEIDVSHLDIVANEEVKIAITGDFNNEIVASDVGYIHAIKLGPSIQIIDRLQGNEVSYIEANETGNLLIKNTGNETITINKILVNNSVEISSTNMNFISGSPTVGIQEVALISFNIPSIKINLTNQIKINVTLSIPSIFTVKIFNATLNPEYYNIAINSAGTKAERDADLIVDILNLGLYNVTVDSVYLNNKLIPLWVFSQTSFQILTDESLSLSVDMDDLIPYTGPINIGSNLEILVRTSQGAEIIHEEVVIT
jgi:dolichyl-diphosphooligosaccharide--protein glycosyltransferase